MKLPKTLKSTAKTRTVSLDGKVVEIFKTRNTVVLKGQGRWAELSRTVKTWKWHCPELSLANMTRLDMEKALLNELGNGVEFHTESLEEWHL